MVATIGDVIGPLLWLGIGYVVYQVVRGPKPHKDFRRWFSTLPPPSSRSSGPRPRTITITSLDPNAHPYDELPMSDLYQHMYDEHFEVWNLLGDKDVAPARWRKEHAADHGLVLR